MRAQSSGNKQQHKITGYRKSFSENDGIPTQYLITYIAELKPQSKAKVCYSVGIYLNNPKN